MHGRQLDQNKIVELRQGVFDGLTQLQRLYVVYVRVRVHNVTEPRQATSLSCRYVQGNEIKALNSEVFAKLSNLKELYGFVFC